MEIPMIAVPELAAGMTAEAGSPATAVAGRGTPSAKGGDPSPFGRLIASLAAQAGQNAQVGTDESQVADDQAEILAALQADSAAASPNQKAEAAVPVTEGDLKALLARLHTGSHAQNPDKKPDLNGKEPVAQAEQVATADPTALLAHPMGATGDRKAESRGDGNKDAPDNTTSLPQGGGQTTAVPLMQALVTPVVTPVTQTAPVPTPAKGAETAATPLTAVAAPVAQTAAVAQTVPQQKEAPSAPEKVLTQAMTVSAQTVAVTTPAITPTADGQKPAATPASPAKAGGETPFTGRGEHIALRQKLAEQGVQVETAQGETPAGKPSKIDLGFAEVVIREAGEQPAAESQKNVTAAPGTEHGRMDAGTSVPLHTQQVPEPARTVQATTPEPARTVSPDQILSQVRDKLASTDLSNQGGQVVIRLHPEELGELKIDVRMEHQQLRVDIVTESPTVKEALQNNMNSLREVLARQNISMDRFNVSTGGNSFNQSFREGQTWAQQQAAMSSRSMARWGGREQADQVPVAAVAQYGRNREYSMLDVRF